MSGIENILKYNISKDIRKSIVVPERYTYKGYNVPRVTEILNRTIHEDYLMRWSNSLGFRRKNYEKVLNDAAEYGTKTHKIIEQFMNNKVFDEYTDGFNAFTKWWDKIREIHNTKIIGSENKLTCPWFGGTYDLLLEIDNNLYLIDFKTSKHITYKYFLQLAAYEYLLNFNNKIDKPLHGLIILQLPKLLSNYSYTEYVLDITNNPQHNKFFNVCRETFMSLVYSYYNINYASSLFNKIQWR
jgi:hypothetical protein